MTPLVRFENASRSFGDLMAVADVTLDVFPGEVLALLGENGAGKSTLMKMLYGIHPPTEGRILLDGVDSPIRGAGDAMRHGIGMVFQHFSLLPALSIRDNLLAALPRTPFLIWPNGGRTEAALQRLHDIAPGIDTAQPVANLSVGEQQLVELCKALNLSARVVVLDEPTSVLTPAEARRLHGFVRDLAADGIAVVLITHKLADVEACADRIAVMRSGRITGVFETGEKPMDEIVRLMMGTEKARVRKLLPPPETRVERLHIMDVKAESAGMALDGVTLTVLSGEILGIAGVAGNGQTLLAEAVAGIHPLRDGDVVLEGVSIARRGEERRSTPLGYIPEQPRANAVVETMSLAANLKLRTLTTGEDGDAPDNAGLMARFRVSPPEPTRLAGTLSGGNLQKLVCARELGTPRRAILACYPTMGLDLGAIDMIYEAMLAQASEGAAVLWISEEIDDLIEKAHRIAVMRAGRIVAILDNDGTLTREQLGMLMTGSDRAEAAA
jgi:simple sugar transport system ATP-binding protein